MEMPPPQFGIGQKIYHVTLPWKETVTITESDKLKIERI